MIKSTFLSRRIVCSRCDEPVSESTGYTLRDDQGKALEYLCEKCGNTIITCDRCDVILSEHICQGDHGHICEDCT